MKKVLVLCIILFFFLSSINARISLGINEAWKFAKGDHPQSMQAAFDDSTWENVTLPHTWNNVDAADETYGYYRGIAWYRRSIHIPENKLNNQVFIYFEGANQETELFVNGKAAGIHHGGYTRFCFDITNLLEFGKQNIFAVKMNNRYNADIPPLSGDFTMFGGIYRDVYLIFTKKQHIATTYYASSGVFITTPFVNEKQASVSIKTLLKNEEKWGKKVQLENIILAGDGSIVAQQIIPVNLLAGTEQSIEQKEIRINNPKLWSPGNPNLYKVITRLYDQKTKIILDEVINPLGFRWYEFSSTKGFFLNGKPLKLIGTNRHQMYLGMGNALSDEIHIRDMKILKEMGANFLRVAHYPQDPVLMEMCDKLGFICSVEIPVVDLITENETFSGNCLKMAREMVMQDFNSPSVIIWSYMNEVLLRPPFKNDPKRHKQYLKSVTKLAKQIENQIRLDDPARYTLIPNHGDFNLYHDAELTTIPMLVGWNLYHGWYDGTFSGFDQFLDYTAKILPDKPMIVTEYGADADIRLHSFLPKCFDYTIEYANLYHEHYLKAIMERFFIAGAAIWNLNEFYSEGRGYAVPRVNCKGIITLDRQVKDTYSHYQAFLSQKPIVTIGGQNWKIRGGVTDINSNISLQSVKVYSNLQMIELKLNNKHIGSQPVNNNIAIFQVPFTNGINILEASGKSDEGVIKDILEIDFRSVPFNLKEVGNSFSEMNIMLGSTRLFEDKTNSIIWVPEKVYTPGSWGYIGGEAYTRKGHGFDFPTSDHEIKETNIDPVFQTMRSGIEAFKMDVPDGKYTICLYFAELQSNKERIALAYNLGNDAAKDEFANRVFNVTINNINAIEKFDLSKTYGEQRAIIKKFLVNATNGEGITISFKKIEGEPILNAIRVYRNY